MGIEPQSLRLGAVCSKIGSGATPRGGKDAYRGGTTSLIRSQNIYNDRFAHEGLAYIDDTQAHELKNVAVEPGDVLLNITGDSVARCCQVDSSILPARVNQHVAIIRPHAGLLDARFLRYSLVSPSVQARLLALSSAGATRNALTKAMLEAFEIDVPPLPTQRAIAHILGALDDKIELNRKTNETLEAMARALFQSWFVDFDPVRAKAAGRAPEGMDDATAKLFPSEFEQSELGEVPKGWRVGSVGDWITLQRGTTYKSSLLGATGPVLLGLASIRRDGGFRSDSLRTYGGESADKLLVEPGDLFVSLKDVTQSGDLLGSVARLPMWIPKGRLTQDTVRLDFEMDGGRRMFVYWLLRLPRLRALCRARATGTTNLGLAREDFLSLPVVMPPNEVISTLMPHISQATFAAEDRIESRTLAALRDALLPKLLSGELAIRDAETFVSRAV